MPVANEGERQNVCLLQTRNRGARNRIGADPHPARRFHARRQGHAGDVDIWVQRIANLDAQQGVERPRIS
jgi:hypothetical protein